MYNPNLIDDYIKSKTNLLKYFNVDQDFHVKVLTDHSWQVKEDDGIFFLTTWNAQNQRQDAVIVKHNNQPLIFRKKVNTLIVAIDCVKIAYILSNELCVELE